MSNEEAIEESKSKIGSEERIKMLNRRVYTGVGILAFPYIGHVYLSYGSWEFITNIFKGDYVDVAISIFVSLLLFMVWMTWAFMRKYI